MANFASKNTEFLEGMLLKIMGPCYSTKKKKKKKKEEANT